MRFLISVGVILSIFACSESGDHPAPPFPLLNTVWISEASEWHSAPGGGAWCVDAKLIYFADSGRFSMLAWTLYKDGKSDSIQVGYEGGSTWDGDWLLTKDIAAVTYRLVDRTVRIVGEQIPGPVLTDTATVVDSEGADVELIFSGERYVKCEIRDPRYPLRRGTAWWVDPPAVPHDQVIPESESQ